MNPKRHSVSVSSRDSQLHPLPIKIPLLPRTAGCHRECFSRRRAANLAVLKLKGWTDAETQAFTTVRGTFPASTTTQQSGQSDAKKATGVKATDAADLEFPAIPQSGTNAAIRTEFKLGIFPPDHHFPPDAPTPTPATSKP